MYKKHFYIKQSPEPHSVGKYFELSVIAETEKQANQIVQPIFQERFSFTFREDFIRFVGITEEDNSKVEAMRVLRKTPEHWNESVTQSFRLGQILFDLEKGLYLSSLIGTEKDRKDDNQVSFEEYNKFVDSLMPYEFAAARQNDFVYIKMEKEVLEITFAFVLKIIRNTLGKKLESIQNNFQKDKETLENLFGPFNL